MEEYLVPWKKCSHFVRWLGIYFVILILGSMNIGTFGSLLKGFAIIPVVIWIIGKHKVCLNNMNLKFILFLGWSALSFLWSIDKNTSFQRIITQSMFLILLFATSGYIYKEKEIIYLKGCLTWSSRVTAIIVLVTGSYYEGRMTLSGVINEDPNYLCAYFLFGIVTAAIGILNKENMKKKIIYVIELLIYIYIVIGTGSRGGLLSIIASAMIIFLFYSTNNNILKNILKKIILFLIVLIVIFMVSHYVDTEILSRFSKAAISSSNGTGRYDLWKDAFNVFISSNLWRETIGYGTGSAISVTYLFPFGDHNVYHNMFIETLVELGVVGLVLYILHIGSFVSMAVRKKEFFSIAVIVGMIVLSLSTSICAFKPYWNIMLFIMCSTCSDLKVIRGKNEIKYCGSDI